MGMDHGMVGDSHQRDMHGGNGHDRVSSGLGANRGILIRNGSAIQMLKNIKFIVLDKTGTITKGEPTLTDVILCDENFSEAQLLGSAASVEAGSAHPLAQAVVDGARDRAINIPQT